MVFVPRDLPLLGAAAPVHATGRYYPSHLGLTHDATSLTTTATRLYYVPYLITEIRSYAGFVMRNTGAGDSGEKVRMGLYLMRDSSLVKAATEVTFSGAAADNVTSDAFTPTELGWHWICAHFDAASAVKKVFGAGTGISGAGYLPEANIMPSFFGVYNATEDNYQVSIPAAWYVDTTYAALASTMVAPTATTSVGPWLALKA